MVRFAKADMSEEEQTDYLKGLPAIPDDWSKNPEALSDEERARIESEKAMTATYVSSGYTSPGAIPERMTKPPAPKKLSMLRQWEMDIRKKTPDKRKRELKILFIRYLDKYISKDKGGPYKYIAHPKQIKNLPSWFEDALVLFDDDEITAEERKGIRTFFHDLIRWRDSQVSYPSEEKLGEMNRQYGTEISPYNPEGVTPEGTEEIIPTEEITGIDIDALKKGMKTGKTVSNTSGEMPDMGDVKSEEIATPEFGGGSIFEETPVTGLAEERESVQAPETMVMAAPPKQPEVKVMAEGSRKLEPVIVPVPASKPRPSVQPAVKPGNLAKIISGGGLNIGPTRSASAGNLERYLIGGKTIARAQQKARPGKKAQQKAKKSRAPRSATILGGLGRVDIGPIGPLGSPLARPMGQPFIPRIHMPKPPKADEFEFWRGQFAGLSSNAKDSERKTVGMINKMIGGTSKQVNISVAPGDMTHAATLEMKRIIPKIEPPIKRGEGNIREMKMLGGALTSLKGALVVPRASREDFRIPDMAPPKYDFGLVSRNKLDHIKKKSREQIDEYVDYIEEED